MHRGNAGLKPEYVLKRANDLINSAVGSSAEKEKRIALEQLHSVICEKKKKGEWNKSYEALMKMHLELCVDLKDHPTAKDGLHQYRNLCFATDPLSLEFVIVHLVELAEQRASVARQKADKVALAAAARVSDLDLEESPESIMLSSMTEEGSKDRTDREVVVPWLKFLWEIYRAVLDLLFKLPKLEKVYHKTCEKAFKFCTDYNRVLEFRRLSDAISTQLATLQRPQVSHPGRSSKVLWEWTAEGIDLHLHTRCAQLEVATSMELWNEAFRTIEDINTIMAMGKRAPKAKLMVTYYDKLTKIFWVADNKLFHAYAWNKLYAWTLESRSKEIKMEEKQLLASAVLLAAITVPSINEAPVTPMDDMDGDRLLSSSSSSALPSSTAAATPAATTSSSSSQFGSLLEFQSNPSRRALLHEIVSKDIISEALPELAQLYNTLESKFSPYTIVKTVAPILSVIQGHPSLQQYVAPLQNVVILKLMQQLARVYSTIKLETLYKLLADLPSANPVFIERVIMDGIASKQLHVRMNHLTASIAFLSSQTSPSVLDAQMLHLGTALQRAVRAIPSAQQERAQRTRERQALFALCVQAAQNDVTVTSERKALIELRKEGLERIQQERREEERRLKELEEERRAKEEEERIALAEAARLAEQKRKAQERMEVLKLQKELERYQIIKDEATLLAMTPEARREILLEAQNKALSAKEEEARKVQEQAKKLDHTERALRIESAKAVLLRQEQDRERDAKLLAEKTATMLASWTEAHQQALKEKDRFEPMQAHRQRFEETLLEAQRKAFQVRAAEIRREKIREKREKVLDMARQAYYEEQARIEREEELERERVRKEERDRLEREQHERLRRQRELEEQNEKQREAELEKMRKQIAEAEAAQRAEREERERKYVPPGRSMGGGPGMGGAAAAAAGASSAAVAPRGAPFREDMRRFGGEDEERPREPAPASTGMASSGREGGAGSGKFMGREEGSWGRTALPPAAPSSMDRGSSAAGGGGGGGDSWRSSREAPRDREPREPRESREPREPRESRESREPRGAGEPREPRERDMGRRQGGSSNFAPPPVARRDMGKW